MKYKMREIDITKQDVRCCDDIEINERYSVNIVWELWFEVDKYFGTNTANSDSWVNFYTEWNYDTNDITAIVCIIQIVQKRNIGSLLIMRRISLRRKWTSIALN